MKVVEGKFGKEEQVEKRPITEMLTQAMDEGGISEDTTGDFLFIALPTGDDYNVTATNMSMEQLIYTIESLKASILLSSVYSGEYH